MFQKPYTNALIATLYIVVVVTFMQNAPRFLNVDDSNFLAPVIFLSLFVLSASIMGFLFVGQPILLYLDGKKKEAVSFFGATVAFFAGITIVIILAQAFLSQPA